jgi:trk system potassium uptake protein TrkA
MRIYIAGGGHTAEFVARRLIREGNELVIIERDPSRIHFLEAQLDAQVFTGDATRIESWRSAGIEGADMFIALTPSDEANVLACLIADNLAPRALKAVQLRSSEYAEWDKLLRNRQVRLDLVIHPETVVAARIQRVLMMPGVSDIRDFAGGLVKAFGMNVKADSWLDGRSVVDLAAAGPPDNSMISLIFRANEVRIPRAEDVLKRGDHLYVVAGRECLSATLRFMGLEVRDSVDQVFILGGGELGCALARELEEQHIAVKIFERDSVRCEELAGILKRSVVINADGTDQEILEQENIEGVDAFLALTKDDECNMITCLLARQLGARKLVALVNRLPNVALAQRLGINTTVSPRVKVVDHILRVVREGGVQSVRTFRRDEAEAIELIAPAGCRYLNRPLSKVHFPHGVVVAAIVKPGDRVIVPRGEAVIEAGDRVVFFALEGCVQQLEADFLRPNSA